MTKGTNRWPAVFVLVTAGLASGVAQPVYADAQRTATLIVTVRTAAGEPVVLAEVRVGERRVYTDRAGEAVLVVPGGLLDVEASAAGHRNAVATVAVRVGESARVSIVLAPEECGPLEYDEEVFVTATRSSTRLQDQALRVEVVDREEIEEKVLMTPGSVAMLLAETTGLRVQTTAPSLGAANVRVQGLRGHYAQLLADGLPLYGAQGNSLSLLQVPPLDLEQVEVIKGAASALYGPAAIGGVINLVSRRPHEPEREALVNITSSGGVDATVWLAETPRTAWGWTLLGGYHGQERRDLDADGWTDLAGFRRALVRPRVHYDNGEGRRWFATSGVMAEDREGGTLAGAVAPDGRPFAERLDTRHADFGTSATWLTTGGRLVALRGSLMRVAHDRQFGEARERGARLTWFGEASVAGASGAHSWVLGGALQQDRYRARDLPRFDFTHTVPALFAQDEVVLSSRLSLSASARLDAHSEYGTLASPRLSLLARPAEGWTLRVSSGLGAFAPTAFTEETDETGLARLVPPVGLEAERARTLATDVTWAAGPVDVSATLFGSLVLNPVQLVAAGPARVAFANAGESTRTWGTELLVRYRRGDVVAMVTHGYTRSTEHHIEAGRRREVPLTPRHGASVNLMREGDWGRAGLEAYYTGPQALDDNPYRRRGAGYLLFGGLLERSLGAISVFLNVENLADVRQTRDDPLTRPTQRPDGRWTVGAWGPLEGRVWNGGLRLHF